MKKQYKYIIGGAVVVILGTALTVFALSQNKSTVTKEQQPPSKQSEQTVKTDPKSVETYDTCLNNSEVKYRTYVTTHGTPYQDQYGKTLYNLPQSDWDKINTDRANEYSDCFNKFYNTDGTLK